MDKKIEFPKWEGYKDLEGVKQLISHGSFNDPKHILEYAAKMAIERRYFNEMLLFIQNRIQRYFEEEGEGLGLGLDNSREIFEGLFIVPAEEVSFPGGESVERVVSTEKADRVESEENKKDVYEQFVEDMERANIEYEEYRGRFFYHGPAVRTDEQGFPTRQDVIRATKVKVQWDNLGRDFIVYPERLEI